VIKSAGLFLVAFLLLGAKPPDLPGSPTVFYSGLHWAIDRPACKIQSIMHITAWHVL